jgi:hypothetical protein
MFEEEHGYPIWLGNQETVENGVRYVYEKSWDKSAGEVPWRSSSSRMVVIGARSLVRALRSVHR